MKLKLTITSIFTLALFSTIAFGQSDDLNIFGYFQDNFHHSNFSISKDAPPLQEFNSFNMQQMNIFFTKNFGTDLSAFINLDFTDSYNSTLNIGGLNVEEAWVKYTYSSAFNVKAGILIPRFNNFNEIKNRTVLLPYIYRPVVYESNFANQFNTSDFIPNQANLQIYGDLDLGSVRFNYAAFMGNLTSDNLVKNGSAFGAGDDTSHYKMVGGRVGLESGNLSLGVSGTYDRKNLFAYNIGYVPRMRFGAYLNYSIVGFDFESEYIRVYNKLSDADKYVLSVIDAHNPLAPKGFNKYYYHFNLLYNFTDKLFAYAGYDYMTSEDNIYSLHGAKGYTFGGGYKLSDSFVLKGQYFEADLPDVMTMDVKRVDYIAGVSIYF